MTPNRDLGIFAPLPPDLAPHEQEQIREAACRHALMTGRWSSMLQRHVEQQLGPIRARVVGRADYSENLFKNFILQAATLYDTEMQVRHSTPKHRRTMTRELERARWFGLQPRNQRMTLAANESFVYWGWSHASKRLIARVVPRHLVRPLPMPDDPGELGGMIEVRRRKKHQKSPDHLPENQEEAWFFDVWDVRDPANPSFRVHKVDGGTIGEDVTARFVNPAEWQGADYPWKLDGRPILPWVVYHREQTSDLVAPYENGEVVFGTLQVGLLWTATVHGSLRASWAQRWISGGKVKSVKINKGTGNHTASGGGSESPIQSVPSDPTRIIIITPTGDSPATAGQWGSPMDIEAAERVSRAYGARLAVAMGLSPADVTIESHTPTSGVSLRISREGLRKIQQRQRVPARVADTRSLVVAAVILRKMGIEVPTDGWRPRYTGIGWTIEEIRDILANVKAMQESPMGPLIDRVGAYMLLHPDLEEEEARDDLAAMDARIQQQQVAAAKRAQEHQEMLAGLGIQAPNREEEPEDEEGAEDGDALADE